MRNRKDMIVAVLVIFCLTAMVFTVLPVSSSGAGSYSPWLDNNDDGKIDVKDIASVARAFGTTGQNISKAGLLYDSGWINPAWEVGQNYTITHGLSMPCTDLVVDARGRMQKWNKTYGGTTQEWARALVLTSDGGYALAGNTNHPYGGGNYDYWLVKTDASGAMQWNKTYGGTGEDGAYALVQTNDGGYALAGYTSSFGASLYDFYLIKTDASGTMQWNRTYEGGIYADLAYALVQTSDGGYAIAGYTYSLGGSGYDFWLVKTDSAGNAQWNKTYGQIGYDFAYALVQTSDGGYALAGNTYGGYWLVKTDSEGNMQWNQTYAGSELYDDWAYAFVQTSDGGYALAGRTSLFDEHANSISDFWLVKTDASGSAQWNKTYGGAGDDRAYALVQTSDGGYALAGLTNSSDAGGYDFWLVKTDSAGNALWNRTYGGTGWDCANALVQTPDGGYAVAGTTESYGAGDTDFWLIKTDASGDSDSFESGLAWADLSADTVTLYRRTTDPYWNLVRVRIWQPKQTP